MRNLIRVIFILTILGLVSCTSKPSPEELTGEIDEIYGLIYDVQATRANSETSWYYTQGKYSLVFEQGGDTKSGTFFQAYLNYLEPQFCALGQTCDCSGEVQSNFKVNEESQTETDENPNSQPYNVFDPYNTPSPENTETSNTEVLKVYSYIVDVTPIASDLSENCREHLTRTLSITRFYSGEIIVRDGYRDVLLRPRTSTSQ